MDAGARPATLATPGSPGVRGAEVASALALSVLAVCILAWRWVGYQGHDDASYAAAALDWVQNFPAVGSNHWALRYPLVLPIAGVIGLSGPSVWALASVNLLAYAAFLVLSYLAMRHWFGWGAGVLFTAIAVLLPQFPVQATYANPDLLEMAFVAGSFWTLMLARERGGPVGLMLLCGALAGLGFLTRETTLALLLLYGLLFLFRPAMPRSRYLLAGLAFTLVVGAQMGYLAARTGDPFYRTKISATHDRVDRAAKTEEATGAGRALDSEGVLATNPVVAPLAALFASQKYGLLFFLALPAYAVLRLGRYGTARQRSVLGCTALGAAVAFLFVAVNASLLYVVPRYFMVPAALAAVPAAVLGAHWLAAGSWRRGAATLAVLAFSGTSLGLLYLENTRPMLAEERLVEYAASAPRVIHVDPETARRMQYLLLVRGLEGRVTSDPPEPDALVAAKGDVVEACVRAPGCALRDRMLPFVPGPGWTEIARQEPPRRIIAGLMWRLGVERYVPRDILRKVEQPGADVRLYRASS